MSAPSVSVSRASVRGFIERQRPTLDAAQAAGTLARTKLDLKDSAEAAFSDIPPELHNRFAQVFQEELDAFCADLRLATVTVQHQVERVVARPKRTGRAIAVAILTFVVVLFITALNVPDPGLGFGLPIVAAVVAFFWAR